MSRSLQHWLPRFLQKGFSSRVGRDGVFVWVHRPDAPALEVNTKKIGGQNNFYGTPGLGTVDATITALEKAHFVPAINKLRTCDPSLPLDAATVARLAAHLCIRSRRLRVASTRTMNNLLATLFKRMTEPSLLESVLNGDSVKNATINKLVEMGVRRPAAKAMAKRTHLLQPSLGVLVQEITKRGELLQHLLLNVVRESHNRALEETASGELRARVYECLTWSLIEFDVREESLILGDSPCVFKVKGNETFKPIDDKGDALELVLLPIATRRLLVGFDTVEALATVTASSANRAAAECSVEFFLGSMPIPEESILCRSIGKRASFFSPSEINRMVEEIVSELVVRGIQSNASEIGRE